MSRYRKIDTRIWNDEKFASLSERAKLVFFMLLTHPGMTALGAMRASLPGLADELHLEPEAFREAFREALSKGMVAFDERAKMIALPNFLKYNPPESPNVVKAWASAIDLLPECSLKSLVIQRAKGFAEALSEAFGKALPEAFAKGIGNQEQEQEPEQEPQKPTASQSAPRSERTTTPTTKVSSPAVIVLPLTAGKTHTITEADVAQFREVYPAVDVGQSLRNILGWLRANPAKCSPNPAGLKRRITNWLARDQERGGVRAVEPRGPPQQERNVPKTVAAYRALGELIERTQPRNVVPQQDQPRLAIDDPDGTRRNAGF